jgi:excisionase family DNA binding protein
MQGTWYTTAEAASTLGITHEAVRNAIQRGALKARKVAPRLSMITADELERYRVENLGRVGRPRKSPAAGGGARE